MSPTTPAAPDWQTLQSRYLRLVDQRCNLNRQLATVALELEPLEAMLQLRLASLDAGGTGQNRSPEPAADSHLTVTDLCRRFSRSKNCIYRWIRSGDIRPIKGIGKPFLFERDEVARFESGRRRIRS